MIPAHLSIHDVAPRTLQDVQGILDLLDGIQAGPVMLLVIPGLAWQPQDLEHLRSWVSRGHSLAAHGWVHKVSSRKNVYHKLHGRLLSRNVAEHLSLSEEEIVEVMQRSFQWFLEHDLPSPTHYVPPAWALGAIHIDRLVDLPYRTIETLSGVIYPSEGRRVLMALLGYEADTSSRKVALKAFNALNRGRASAGTPLRISIHPKDLKLKLSQDVMRDCQRFQCYADLV